MSESTIIPLSLTIMLGPQILVAMLLITRKDAIKSSLTYILSLVLTLVCITYFYYKIIDLTSFHKIAISGKPVIKYILVGILLIILMGTIKNRKKITESPKWMTNVLSCSLKKIALFGFMLIALMPADVAIEFTIGNLLNTSKAHFTSIIPFFIAVLIIASMPLLVYLSLGKKGPEKMEKTNTWLNTHGYIINIVVLLLYIFLLLK